jgi:hypothetical protein
VCSRGEDRVFDDEANGAVGLGCNCELQRPGQTCELRRTFGLPSGYGPFSILEGFTGRCVFLPRDSTQDHTLRETQMELERTFTIYGDSHLGQGTGGLEYREPVDTLATHTIQPSRGNGGIASHTISGGPSFNCLIRGARSGVVVFNAEVLALDPNTKVRCSIDMNEDYYLRPHLNVEP